MKIIDLSYPIETGMPVYPGDTEVNIHDERTWEADGFRLSSLHSTMHAGTHIDAPSHISDSNVMMKDIDLRQCIGIGVLVDVRNKNIIDVEDVQKMDIKAGDIVIFLTGWSKHYSTPLYNDHPVLSEALAELLVMKKISMLGIDMPSCDHEPYPVHKILMKAGILIAENLCNCESLLDVDEFDVFAIPLKIDAEASLSRVFAIAKEKTA
jgi:kynurenine formamidase